MFPLLLGRKQGQFILLVLVTLMATFRCLPTPGILS